METGLIIFALAVSAISWIYCMSIKAPIGYNGLEKELYIECRVAWSVVWVAIAWCLVGWAI